MTAAFLVLVAPCSLLLGAVLEVVFARLFGARAKALLAALSCLPAVVAVLALIPRLRDGRAIDLNLVQWDGPLTLSLHVDALSVLFAFMGTVLGGAVLLYSIGYMAHEKGSTRFFATMLVFIAGFVSLVYSANLFLFYLCWELIGLCSFSLVGFWYTNPQAVRGARKVLLMTHIAGYGLLAAILMLYARSGASLWSDPALAHSMTGGIFLLMLLALVAKSVQFPLHTWIPEAMAAPTPVSALLHAACYVKAGVYLAARLHSLGNWPVSWSVTLVWIGTVTMAVGVMYAMVQTDLKRMLAFSTVSQIGYMMLGLGIGTPLALAAALLHCLNHGFFKGGLFLTAGAVQHATGTRDMNRLGGLAQRMPRTTLSWLIGVGSMMGIPLMSGFASKWMLYAAALEAGWAVPAVVAWAVSLGTVFLGAKATSAVFLGPLTDDTRHAHESAPTMVAGMSIMAVGSVVLGIAPQLAVNLLLNPVLAAYGLAPVQVTWLGLSSGAGSFSTVGGLLLALVSLVMGLAVYWIARASRLATIGGAAMIGAGGGIFTGGEPLEDDDRMTAGDFSAIFEEHWKPFFRFTHVDSLYLALWRGLDACAQLLSLAMAQLERFALPLMVALAAVVFALLRALTPAVDASLSAPVMEAHIAPELIAAIALASLAFFLAALVSGVRQSLPLWVSALTLGGLSVAGLMVHEEWLRLGLLEVAALVTIVRVALAVQSRTVRFLYAAVVLLSAASLIASQYLAQHGDGLDAGVFLITAILVKLALLPFSFWLLRMADELPAILLGLIISVIDMAAFAEFALAAERHPTAFAPQALLLSTAAVTALLAALLMLRQSSLKRLLVLSTVEDAGFLLLGLASLSSLGEQGALAAATAHSIAKALLFIALTAPERDGALLPDARALAARYPVSAFGFLIGLLAMLGLPPFMGFMGRWRLYTVALHLSPALLAVCLLASISALIAYIRALTRFWWGEPSVSAPVAASEPLLLRLTIFSLAAVLLLVGLWPNLLLLVFGGHA